MINKNDLKQIIKEEYHNVKNFMEEKYGFVPELGKVVSNPYAKAFTEATDAEEKEFHNKLDKLVHATFGKSPDEEKEDKLKSEETESDAEMAVDQLQSSVEHAQQVIDKLKGRTNLEPWVQSLITKAEDYLNIVNNVNGGEEIDEYDVETIEETRDFINFMKEHNTKLTESKINEAEYQGRKVKLGKIMQGDVKKFKVYVKNDKGNVVKVNFGQGGDAKGGTMRIRKDNPEARKSFRARHNCDNPGPRWKARYWSCRKW